MIVIFARRLNVAESRCTFTSKADWSGRPRGWPVWSTTGTCDTSAERMRVKAVSKVSSGPTEITSPASCRWLIKSLKSPCGWRETSPCSAIQQSLYIFERYLLPVSKTRGTTRFCTVCRRHKRKAHPRRVRVEAPAQLPPLAKMWRPVKGLLIGRQLINVNCSDKMVNTKS